jgi:hypothetical protein
MEKKPEEIESLEVEIGKLKEKEGFKRNTPIKRSIGTSRLSESREYAEYSGAKLIHFSASFSYARSFYKVAGQYSIKKKDESNKLSIRKIKKDGSEIRPEGNITGLILQVADEFLKKEKKAFPDEERPSVLLVTYFKDGSSESLLLVNYAKQSNGSYIKTKAVHISR